MLSPCSSDGKTSSNYSVDNYDLISSSAASLTPSSPSSDVITGQLRDMTYKHSFWPGFMEKEIFNNVIMTGISPNMARLGRSLVVLVAMEMLWSGMSVCLRSLGPSMVKSFYFWKHWMIPPPFSKYDPRVRSRKATVHSIKPENYRQMHQITDFVKKRAKQNTNVDKLNIQFHSFNVFMNNRETVDRCSSADILITKDGRFVEIYPGVYVQSYATDLTLLPQNKIHSFKHRTDAIIQQGKYIEYENISVFTGNGSIPIKEGERYTSFDYVYQNIHLTFRLAYMCGEDAVHNEFLELVKQESNNVNMTDMKNLLGLRKEKWDEQIYCSLDIFKLENAKRKLMSSVTTRRHALDTFPFLYREKLISSITNFCDKDYYVAKGITRTMGFLLYGPPGCGKTSLIRAIAAKMNYNICIVTPNDFQFDDSIRATLEISKNIMYLIEEVDCVPEFMEAFSSRTKKEALNDLHEQESDSVITNDMLNKMFMHTMLKGVSSAEKGGGDPEKLKNASKDSEKLDPKNLCKLFLELMDGITSCDGFILIMTTNHPEKLDPAFLRRGRFTHIIKLDRLLKIHVLELYKQWFPYREQPVLEELHDHVFVLADIPDIFGNPEEETRRILRFTREEWQAYEKSMDRLFEA